MKLGTQNYVLGFAATLCFLDGLLAPKGSDPGPLLTAVMGILLVRRAVIITPQSPVVLLAGCLLGGISIMGNHSLINANAPIYLGLIVISAICYGLWERIVKIWT